MRSWIAVLIGAPVLLGFVLLPVVRDPRPPARPPLVVDDVSQLNPIKVSAIVEPTSYAEVADAVARHTGPVSIGGGRHSMGGQIATENALFIDMRRFDKVLEVDPEARTVRVQAGATWREVQDAIDPFDLSVKVMQSYANFTVGGSLSVNAHGRYVGNGPVITTVKSIKVVMADGSSVEASPTRNRDIFFGAIGGYGGLGVIVEATIDLTDNVRVKREAGEMSIGRYARFFRDGIQGQSERVLHEATVSLPDFARLREVTYTRTTEPLSVRARLRSSDGSYRLNRLALWIQSEWPLGSSIGRYLFDQVSPVDAPVSWRNYEASYDVAELEPASRESSTYLMQEYYVPTDRFDQFVSKMREILRLRDVNVLNISITHSLQDPGSLLAWAQTDVVSFLIHYKQDTTRAALAAEEVWTRELVNAALNVNGSYYLGYRLNATPEQFARAYPHAAEFVALKRRVDPTNKFRNRLIDRYLQ
jgi:FAD/FMN-containing dehydrogenase